jgi:hypothetical protein
MDLNQINHVISSHQQIYQSIKDYRDQNGNPYDVMKIIGCAIFLHNILKKEGQITPAEKYIAEIDRLELNLITPYIGKSLPQVNQTNNQLINHYKYLLICLMVYQPPLRGYDNILIISSPNDYRQELKTNWIVMSDDYFGFYICDDQMVDLLGRKRIPIINQKLRTILRTSYSQYPRSYLFEQLNEKGMSMNRDQINQINPYNLNQMRARYIESTTGLNMNSNILGSMMRCSSRVIDLFRKYIQSNSIKSNSIQSNSIQSNPIQSNPIQSNPIQSNPIQSNPIQSNPIQSNPINPTIGGSRPINPTTGKPMSDARIHVMELGRKYRQSHPQKFRDSSKKYYEENKEKIIRKRIVTNLNSGRTDEPGRETIEKYKLKYDKQKKQWV